MNTIEVTMVRIYLTEGEGVLKNLLKRLHDWEKVKGVTVFRGISGFGGSGVTHTSVAVELMMDLPVVGEFFDEPEKVKAEKGAYGYNAETEEYGDLMKAGVIDPTKVVRFALQNAASVSSLLLTTQAMVAEKPEEKESMPAMPPGGGMGGMGGMM